MEAKVNAVPVQIKVHNAQGAWSYWSALAKLNGIWSIALALSIAVDCTHIVVNDATYDKYRLTLANKAEGGG